MGIRSLAIACSIAIVVGSSSGAFASGGNATGPIASADSAMPAKSGEQIHAGIGDFLRELGGGVYCMFTGQGNRFVGPQYRFATSDEYVGALLTIYPGSCVMG